MSAAFRTIESGSAPELDPDLLPAADRALLRLLVRCGAATSEQLAHLTNRSHRQTQRRLLLFYRAGLVERAAVPHPLPGNAELAYRLGPLGHDRLHTRRRVAPASYLRHTLDTNDVVCALNRSPDGQPGRVQLWLTDAMTADVLGHFVRPDSIVVVTEDDRSAVLALEIDEGTEHARTVRAKLAAYRRPLLSRPAWHLVVVVPGPIRADWMLRQAASLELGPRAWVVTRSGLLAASLDAPLQPLGQAAPTRLGALLAPPMRLVPTPLGSQVWIELLAAGGGEELDGVLGP